MTSSPPPSYYSSTVMSNSRSFTPDEFTVANASPIIFQLPYIQREALSPLPDSFYNAYSHQFPTTGLPLLTPPDSNLFKKESSSYIDYCSSEVLPPPPTSCFTPGCNCSLTVLYNNGMMSPNPMLYDPPPFNNNFLPPPPPMQQRYKKQQHRPYYKPERNHSLDSNCSLSSSSSSSSVVTSAEKASTPRRYKCTLCVKRFTRPSSLATHMHSHTGEKPYKCLVDGCGRRFSVVSNLRRHAKIHNTTTSTAISTISQHPINS